MKDQAFKNQFNLIINEMCSRTIELPWENKIFYAQWIANSYEYVSNSTRILALTAGKFPYSLNALSMRFIQHASEERNHEKLLELDLKKLGIEWKSLNPTSCAKSFHQSLYYHVFQGNPLSIMGWVLALEGFAVTGAKEIYKRVSEAHGDKASRFLGIHCTEDEDHIAKALETLEKLSQDERKIVLEAMALYADLYCQMCLSGKQISRDQWKEAA